MLDIDQWTPRCHGHSTLSLVEGLLSKKDRKTSAESDAVTGPLIIGREASGVGALGDLAVEDLLEGVLARERLAVGVLGGNIHQMHFGGFDLV